MDRLVQHQQTINDQLARYGVKFGLYKNGTFQERLFPFDPLPRVITAQEFETLDRGLVQRVNALNLFLKDVYGDKKIIRDGIVPEDFVFAGSGYLPQCEGFVPPKGVYSHISGIDLVQAKGGSWFILEDNLRIPSGASYPLIARELCRRCSPETFSGNAIVDNRNYAQLLRQTRPMRSAFTPRRPTRSTSRAPRRPSQPCCATSAGSACCVITATAGIFPPSCRKMRWPMCSPRRAASSAVWWSRGRRWSMARSWA